MQISFSVVNLPQYKLKMQLGSTLEIPIRSTIFDIIAHLDQKFWNGVYPSLTVRQKQGILLFKHVKSLLQVLWNPKLNRVYTDVIFEARNNFSSAETLPLLENPDYIIPKNADICIGPDQGC